MANFVAGCASEMEGSRCRANSSKGRMSDYNTIGGSRSAREMGVTEQPST